MLTMKEAVIQAKSYATELYEDENIQDLSLEEIDFDTLSNHWKVTLGYNAKRHSIETSAKHRARLATEVLGVFGNNEPPKTEMVREYKIFEINAQDGSLIKMLIRPL